MKKLLVMALGLGIALGTLSFAQDDKKMDDTKTTKKAKKAKKAKKSTDATSTDKKM